MTYDFYSEYTGDVETQLGEIRDQIEAGVEYVWERWNDSIIAKGLDSDWAWLVSPGLKAGYEWAKGELEDEIDRLWDEFETFVEDLWEKVDDLTGNPWQLMDMNADYHRAAGRLRDEKIVINRLTWHVRKRWQGVAFDAYWNAATEQSNAIQAVDQGLVKAATACAEGAEQIRSIWRDCIDAMLDVVNAILDAIKDGTDAGQWVTFDAGPAIKVIGKCLTTALGLWNDLDRYFDTNVTVKVSMWRELNSGLDGLDASNDWPQISEINRADIDDNGNWAEK